VTSRTVFFPKQEWLSLGSLVAVVSGLTAAERAHLIPLSVLAASPHAVAESRFWLLLTSALLVQSPLFWSLVAFALLGALTLEVCGRRVFWISALAGHIGSTLVVYALLAFARTFDPRAFQAVLKAPDYGVSAISAAWLGAIASVSWQARERTLRGKIATVLAVLATALFGWMLHTHVSFLDLEHVVAFVIGITVAVRLPRTVETERLAVGAAHP
jgi:type IV secretory pathway VirB2 component (pilin)